MKIYTFQMTILKSLHLQSVDFKTNENTIIVDKKMIYIIYFSSVNWKIKNIFYNFFL